MTNSLSQVATGAVTTFGSTAHKIIDTLHGGGERLNAAATRRWNAALKQSSAQLTAETRRNAAHAHKVFSGYYTRGLDLSAGGARVAVDTVVGAALTGLRKAG